MFPSSNVLLVAVLLSITGVGGEHEDCRSLQCLNNSPCQTTVSQSKGGTSFTHAQCICRGYWTGPRCQYRIYVTAENVTSDTVYLKIVMADTSKLINISHSVQLPVVSPSMSSTSSGQPSALSIVANNVSSKSSSSSSPIANHRLDDSAAFLHFLNYTITYWTNTSDRTCRLLQEMTSLTPAIHGLQSNSLYLFCAESGPVDSCVPAISNISTADTNCVQVVTDEALSEPTFLGLATVTLVSMVTVGLVSVVLTGILVFWFCRYVSCRHFCLLCCTCKYQACWCSQAEKLTDSPRLEHTREIEFSPTSALLLPAAVNFSLPSPDLRIHRPKSRRLPGTTLRNGGTGHLQTLVEDPADESSCDTGMPLIQQETSAS